MRARALAGLAALLCSGWAMAQGFPAKPITFVVPAPAGGGTDAIARALAEQMGQRLGQPIVVDNRPGAAGMLGTQAVARAAPDGYTVLVTNTGPVLYAPFMFKKMAYDPQRDLAPITELCAVSMVFGVAGNVPARTMPQYIAWARQNVGKLQFGSYGPGSASHLISAYFNHAHGLRMEHAAYKGEAPMTMAVLSGEVHHAVGTMATMGPYIADGRMRALAVLGRERLAAAPELPTMAEVGLKDPEYQPIGGLVMMAPAGTPPAVLARIEQEAIAAIHSTPLKARLQVYGMVGVGSSAAAFARALETARPMVGQLVKMSGVQPQ